MKWAWLGCVLFAVLPCRALAHDPPFVYDVVWGDAAHPTLFLTNRGFIIRSEDAELRLLCSRMLQVSTTEQVDVVRAPDGAWLVGTSHGLLRSADSGCSFDGVAELAQVPVYALRRDPMRSAHLVAATGETPARVFHSEDSGQTWTAGFQLPQGTYYEEFVFAPGTDGLLYAGALTLGKPVVQQIAVSRDGGKSFEAPLSIPLEDAETDTTLLDVGAGAGELLLVRAQAGVVTSLDRLLRSDDGGKSFTTVLRAQRISSARFSSDGSRVFATALDGMWISEDAGQTFQKVPDADVMSYASEHAGELVVSGRYEGLTAERWGVGIAADSGGEVRRLFDFAEVQQPVHCPSDSMMHALCSELWLDWMREFPEPSTAGAPAAAAGAGAAGSSTAGAPAAAGSPALAGAAAAEAGAAGSGGAPTTTTTTPQSGGCAVAPGRQTSALSALLAAAALAALWGVRRGGRTARAAAQMGSR